MVYDQWVRLVWEELRPRENQASLSAALLYTDLILQKLELSLFQDLYQAMPEQVFGPGARRFLIQSIGTLKPTIF